jgi:hypothetical protein
MLRVFRIRRPYPPRAGQAKADERNNVDGKERPPPPIDSTPSNPERNFTAVPFKEKAAHIYCDLANFVLREAGK